MSTLLMDALEHDSHQPKSALALHSRYSQKLSPVENYKKSESSIISLVPQILYLISQEFINSEFNILYTVDCAMQSEAEKWDFLFKAKLWCKC